MGKGKRDSRGFTLIAALLITVLLSAVAVGLLYMVGNEVRMGGNDLEANNAYYGAEAGMESLTAQLSQLYQTSQSPTAADINALWNPATAIYPTQIAGSNVANTNYTYSIVWPATKPDGTACPNAPNPCGAWDIVGSGPDQGMVASLIPFTLQVTATRQAGTGQVGAYSTTASSGAALNMTRTVEVALLPAFEFGIFCDGDCDYFAGPAFNFGGRVHTNGNLFLASGSTLTFTDKIAAVGQVVTDRLENNHLAANGYTGQVYVPTAGGGCPPAPGAGPAANCLQLPAGSWAGGIPTGAGAANPGWKTISKATFGGYIENGLTGATKLQLPFLNTNDKVGAIDIIRRPQAGDTALLSSSRLYTKAEIRILIADSAGDLHPDRGAAALPGDVQVVLPGAGGSQQLAGYAGVPATSYMYYATATTGANGWVTPTVAGCASPYPLLGEVTVGGAPCQGVWLRVEYLDNGGNWNAITSQWLGYGFGRGYNMPPTAPYAAAGIPACSWYPAQPAGQCYNPISPAILILQQLQQGKNNPATQAWEGTSNNAASTTAGNWIPINFYDSREGEPRDNAAPGRGNNTTAAAAAVYTPCGAAGVMNAVELDVGNLWLWLQGKAPYVGSSGPLVNNAKDNGYILYFSDRRGQLPDPNNTGTGLYNRITGMSGLEDTVNSASAAGVPDGALEPAAYYAFSPEDVNGDGFLDNWGQKYLGAGFGLASTPTNYMAQPYAPVPANPVTSSANQVNCNTDQSNTLSVYTGAGSPQNNMVTGPRHVLRLVDGGMDAKGNSYLPQPIAPATSGNGFTVSSEEPVYVWGDYNSGAADPFFPTSGANATTPHSAAAIIADAVTLLSNPPSGASLPVANVGWTDVISYLSPGAVANGAANSRAGNTSYYRVAIAAGKSIPFPQPAWGPQDFGTDGGMHNFLRYLEDRGANGATVNYAGSLISMYYSQYATGVFKCCNVVYSPPNRNYFFDTQFLNPANLPPGTPMFQDVVSLSYRQNFTPQ